MLMHRVNTIATGLDGGQWLNTLWFDQAGGSSTDAKAAVGALWVALAPQIHNQVQMTVQAEVFQVESTTDQVVGVSSLAPTVIQGTNTGSPLPAATQGLVKVLTGAYVGGRQVRGRVYLWGPTTTTMQDAGTTAAYRTAVNAAFRGLRDSTACDWIVYTRSNRIGVRVSEVATWQEWGVLRSRRD